MPTPKSKEEVQRFVAMVGYLGKFIPKLSEKTKILRELYDKDVAWHWDTRHQKAVDDLKAVVTSAPVLQLYDVNKPVT